MKYVKKSSIVLLTGILVFYIGISLSKGTHSAEAYSLKFSEKLNVDEENNFIKYISVDTTVSDLLDNVTITGNNVNVNIYDLSNNVKNQSDSISSGDFLITYENNKLKDVYVLAVTGDSNGDGLLDLIDLVQMRKHIVGWINPDTKKIQRKEGIYYHTLDFNVDEEIDLIDLVRMRKTIVGTNQVSLNIPNCGNGIELKVGDTQSLKYTINPSSTKSVNWSSSNANIVTVDNKGKITAKSEGTTNIIVNIGDVQATCSIKVKPTYIANISQTSTSIIYDSSYTETLTVTTTKKTGTNSSTEITEGLSYKWYLNGSEITNATSKTYKAKEYGLYRAIVYKDGEELASNYYRNTQASTVNYTLDTSSDTKFVFVNNPEPIDNDDFVDNGKVIYKTSFDKNMEMYFEHNRNTNTEFYYGIRIYNPTEYNVTLTINNSGISARYGGEKDHDVIWEQYYTKNVTYRIDSETGETYLKESYTMTPGQYLYFWMVQDLNMPGKVKYLTTLSNYAYNPYNDYLPSDTIPIKWDWSWAFDGVLNLSAKVSDGAYLSSKGGKLEVANIAVSKSFYKSENKDAINSASTITEKEGGQLTGEYAGKPIVTNTATFTINDSTPAGTIPMYYRSTSDENSRTLKNGWITNLSGSSDIAYQKETIPLSGINKDGEKYTLTPFGNIITANYAVHYHENITIVNNSSKSRNVAFYINTGSGTASISGDTTWISFVTNSNGEIVKDKYTSNGITVTPTATFDIFEKRTNVEVWKATIPAGSKITIPSINLVGGMSFANIIKMVCVDNECYDAFAGETFKW